MSKRMVIYGIVFFCIAAMSIAEGKKYFRIDPAKCTACGICAQECPEGAISAGTIDGKEVYIIDPQKCTACGVCAEVCPEKAITAASDEPVEAEEIGKESSEKKEPDNEGAPKKKAKKASKYEVK